MKKILIIEDHPIYRDGLAVLVAQLFAEAQVEQAGDAAMALEQLAQDDTFDLVLLDLKMPGLDASTALAVLCRRHPAGPVVVVSADDDAATIRPAWTPAPAATSRSQRDGRSCPPHSPSSRMMTLTKSKREEQDTHPQEPRPAGVLATALAMLWRDKFATVAALILIATVIAALIGPALLHDAVTGMNLRARNAPPFELERGLAFILSGDSLGRGILPRIIVEAQNTMMIAASAVLLSLVVGTALGLVAGYRAGVVGDLIMRLTDILMSFPSLLLAMVVLYVFAPSIANVIFVLALTPSGRYQVIVQFIIPSKARVVSPGSSQLKSLVRTPSARASFHNASNLSRLGI